MLRHSDSNLYLHKIQFPFNVSDHTGCSRIADA
jgi:hypothetical protein